ncbi:MAG: hypothetical protein H7315_11350 [Herminiimonas sp.]|nr:hypothetical protein [Herminiimonas sp.]
MASIEDIVKRQKDGAKFVLSASMMGLDTEEFDIVARVWIKDGGNGFQLAGVPHRRCIDGQFFIDRITVVKTAESGDREP